MANATTRDARAGFAIFLQRDGAVELDAINSRLEASGYGRIAQRTLTHYHNLVRAGFNRYISINRFDVARASRPYENLSTLSRYRYHTIDQEIIAVLSKSGRMLEIRGRMIESGDVGAVLAFSEEEVLLQLRQYVPRPGVGLNLHMVNSSAAISATVIDSDLTRSPALLEVEYTTLVSLAEIEDSVPLQNVLAQFTLVSRDDGPAAIDVIGRRLHNFFDLLEGIRSLLNEAGRHSEEHVYAAPPIVHEIRVSSPAVLLLQVSHDLLSIVPWPLLIALFPAWRKTWHKGTREKREAQLADVKRQRAELDLEKKKMESSLYSQVIENVRAQLPSAKISDSVLEQIWLANILPSYRALSRSDVQEIIVEEEESSEESEESTDEDNADDDG